MLFRSLLHSQVPLTEESTALVRSKCIPGVTETCLLYTSDVYKRQYFHPHLISSFSYQNRCFPSLYSNISGTGTKTGTCQSRHQRCRHYKNKIISGEFQMCIRDRRMVPPLLPAHYPLTCLRNIHFKNINGEAQSAGTMYGFKAVSYTHLISLTLSGGPCWIWEQPRFGKISIWTGFLMPLL